MARKAMEDLSQLDPGELALALPPLHQPGSRRHNRT
jgi:hypothetical protein